MCKKNHEKKSIWQYTMLKNFCYCTHCENATTNLNVNRLNFSGKNIPKVYGRQNIKNIMDFLVRERYSQFDQNTQINRPYIYIFFYKKAK